jgi:hypothetical protein
MKDYKQLIKELPSNTIVCAVGEFNPPTVGHELLVKTVKKLAEQKRSAHVIYTSPSKNSLIQEDKKAHYLNIMFPKTTFKSLSESKLQQVITELHKKYKKVILVAGTDQLTEMRKLQNVELISVDKDPEADNTKMKQFASKGIYEEFKKKLPSTIRDIDGKRLMNEMRTGLGLEPIKEQIVLVKDKLREKYFRGEIFNEGDIVESNGEKFTIVKRGSNHLLLKESNGKLISKWIQDVKPTEEKEMNESSKLAEAAIQPNGTDKIDTKTSEPMNSDDKTSDVKVKKGMITFYNYSKAQKIQEQEHSMADKKKDNESDHDYENEIKVTGVDQSEVGHTLVHAGGQDNLRRRKVKYKLGEEVTENPAAKELAKANLAAKHAKEKESLASKHEQEKEQIKEAEYTGKGAGKPGWMLRADPKLAMALKKAKERRKFVAGTPSKEYMDKNKTNEEVELEEAKKKPLVGVAATTKPFDPFFEDNTYDQTVDVATPQTPIETSEEDDIDDKEIEAMIGNLSDEEIMDEYGEDELGLVDDETGEEIPKSAEEDAIDEQAIMEVLSRTERMKAKFRIRRTAAKRERATKIALKRYSNTATINKRARRLAIKLMKQRMLRGRDPSKLSVGEKERIERALEQRKAVIGRIATRLVPRVRKVEKARMSHSKFTQGSQPSVF